MKLTRCHSFRPMFVPMQQLQNEMNRLFTGWGTDGCRLTPAATVFPAVNMWEDADAIFVEAELPGLDSKDLEIHVAGGNQLTIKGERKQAVPEGGIRHRHERGAGSFSRVVMLPFAVDQDKVDARFENGVLSIKLPKHEAAKPRKINVKCE